MSDDEKKNVDLGDAEFGDDALDFIFNGEEHIIHSVCPDPYDLLTFRLVREER